MAFGEPVCASLSTSLLGAGRSVGATVHQGGTYVCIEGPQFSTKAESQLYRQWGVSVIGMTNLPEAKLAREAELCYATVALVTDYDCWHETEECVTVEAILATLVSECGAGQTAAGGSREIGGVSNELRMSAGLAACDCHALRTAFPPPSAERLALLIERVLSPVKGKR